MFIVDVGPSRLEAAHLRVRVLRAATKLPPSCHQAAIKRRQRQQRPRHWPVVPVIMQP